jgi:uncharacterized protein YcnI/copper(I)-binding protein
MNTHFITAAAAGALALTLSTQAFAHASLAVSEAPAESYFTLELRIPHGCDGKPTTEIDVKLPEGFVFAKPRVKPGWTIEIVKGDYQKTYDNHGKQVKAGALEIRWKGGEIPDDQFDSVEITGKISGIEPGTALPFVTTQKCGADGEVAWNEIAGEGQNPHDLEHPAPTLTITAAEGGHHHDHAAMQGNTAAGEAGAAKAGDLDLSAGVVKGMLPGQKVAGGFVTIRNGGGSDDRLVSVSSSIADHVEIHEMSMENDVMKMRPLKDGLPVKAGETVTLAPGGYHLMFMGVKQPVKAGETVTVTFTFEKAGSVDIALPVVDPRGMAEHKHN